jgi:mRNA interferase RelE/StbE
LQGTRRRIEYKASVLSDLERLDPPTAKRIVSKIEKTLAEGRVGEAFAGEFRGLFRMRVGDYRVVYAPTDVGYLILRIGHRREVYRKGRPVR